MIRVVLAILFSPLIVAFIMVVFEPILLGRIPSIQQIASMLPITYLATCVGLIVFGYSICYLLKKLNKLNLTGLTILGGLGGMTYLMLVIFVLTSSSGKLETDLKIGLFGFVLAVVTALTFGLLSGISSAEIKN